MTEKQTAKRQQLANFLPSDFLAMIEKHAHDDSFRTLFYEYLSATFSRSKKHKPVEKPPTVDSVIIFFDGGCKPNPGQKYGSWIYRWKGKPIERSRKSFGFGTNNEAEYESLLDCLKAIEGDPFVPKNARLSVFSDSQLLIKQLQGRWKIRQPSLVKLALRIQELTTTRKVEYCWNSRDTNVELFGH